MTGAIDNLHITVEGDPTVALSWVPFGRRIVLELMASGLYAVERTVVVDDTAEVRAKIVGQQRFIHIKASACFPYLESGQGSTGATADGDPNKFNPGTYRLGTLDPLDPLLGKVSLKFPLSDSAEPKLVDGQIALCLSAGGPGQDGRYPSDGALLEKKRCFNGFRPSMLSGKARLWLQSLYGAKHRKGGWDFTYAQGGEGVLWYKGVLPVGSSTGLFTSEDYRYWLLQPSGGRLKSYALRLTSCGNEARLFLLAHATELSEDEQRKLEGVILSLSSIDLKSVRDLGPVPSISPLAYGWHFSWSGAKMSAVSVVPKNPGTTLSRYVSTIHTCTVAVQGDILVLLEASTGEPKEWQVPRGYMNIWYPNYAVGALQWLVDPVANLVVFSSSGPIYCFYEGEQLRLTEIDTSIKSGITETTRTLRCPASHQEFPYAFYPALNERPYSETRVYGVAVTCNASAGTASRQSSNSSYSLAWSGVFENVLISTERDWSPFNQMPFDNELLDPCEINDENTAAREEYDAIAATWPGGGTLDSVYNSYDLWRYRSGTKNTTVQEGVFAIIAIPFYDCEAVYVGHVGSRREFGQEVWAWWPSETGSSGRFQRYLVPFYENGGFKGRKELSHGSPLRSEFPIGGTQYDVDQTTPVDLSISLSTSKGAFSTRLTDGYGSLFTPSMANPFSSHVFQTNISAGGCAMGDDVVETCGFLFNAGPFIGWA